MTEHATATMEHKAAFPYEDTKTGICNNKNNSEKNVDFEKRDAVGSIGGDAVTEAVPADEEPPLASGGLKAWLDVLATFFMFMSAW